MVNIMGLSREIEQDYKSFSTSPTGITNPLRAQISYEHVKYPYSLNKGLSLSFGTAPVKVVAI
jgi:hypothetical protein